MGSCQTGQEGHREDGKVMETSLVMLVIGPLVKEEEHVVGQRVGEGALTIRKVVTGPGAPENWVYLGT